MSIQFQKLNKPGLGGATFGSNNQKKSGVSAQATKNLANSSAASKTSLFSFNQTHKHNWVGGVNTVKGQHRYNYDGMRARANSVRYTPPEPEFYANPASVQMPNYSNNSYNTGVAIASILNAGVNLAGQLNELGLFGSNSTTSTSSSNSQALDRASASLGRQVGHANLNSSGANSAISSMSGAKDSISLRSAIADANGTLSKMDAQAASGKYEANANKAKDNMDRYEASVKTADGDVTKAKQGVKTADQSVRSTKDVRDTKLAALKNADATYGKAVEAHTQAIDAKNQAKQNLANTPETIPDGNGGEIKNPAYEQALTALKQAEAAEEQAKAQRDAAKRNVDTSNKALTDAESQLDKAQGMLDKAKDGQTKAQTVLKTAQKGAADADKILKQAQDDVEKFKAYQQDRKELEKEIAKQNERLAKLEKEEQKDYEKLTSKIDNGVAKNDKRASQIDPSDGMNLKEKWLQRKMERRNDKMDRQLDEKDSLSPAVQDSQYITELKNGSIPAESEFHLGEEKYVKGTTPSGQEVYFRGDEPITKEMFDEANSLQS